ncbi:uncharacterized protein LOC115885353 isoform X1 [Sitophilus oryzae]|uniref:Uncharacterized protein LOC115885353 isoform X1 n=1 Tax=Sitophilus oryzae TaxID=7048 RepID=A0A6J2Y9B1_SITOR|nr:uncharacterized protein LOC115885353 isoform X1 [Sitophilus oryzae]
MDDQDYNPDYQSRKLSITTYAPAEVAYKGYRFLITMKPSNVSMVDYVREMKNHNVKAVVKLCEEGYDVKKLNENGISVLDLSFPDGKPPPDSIIEEWFKQLDGYIPGQDYPIYNEVPQGLSFRCDQRPPGYYSDPEAQCQVWHWCLPNGQKFSFLCPNGTIFNQFARVCDWWFNVDCAATPNLYGINEDLYRIPPPYKGPNL